ncbi:hypothetical protein OXX59_008918 [Metschnikowia pulcherrima]
MFNFSPNNSAMNSSQDQNNNHEHGRVPNSVEPYWEPHKSKNTNLRVLHPNSSVPGRWLGAHPNEKKFVGRPIRDQAAPVSSRNLNQSHIEDESSLDEFFETTDKFSQFSQSRHYTEYNPLSSKLEAFDPHIKPHMTEPLLPDGSPLDFSGIRQYRGETNIYSTTPLARVWEFSSSTDKHEYSILNILADEFENLDTVQNEPKQGLWSSIKKYTVGLSEDEYDEQYPWAKYCNRSLSESGDEDVGGAPL